jgi:hypothetical protein
MAGDASAYHALGLEPGADKAAVDRAYKKLIKQHHPDREGGDSARATEINQAYRELRGARPEKDALDFHDHFPEQRRNFGWTMMALAVVGALAALMLSSTPMTGTLQEWSPASARPLPLAAMQRAAPADPMDQPLRTVAIDSAVRDARHIARTRDEMGLAAESNLCHGKLRNNPDVAQLDRCAAFDDAVVLLQDRDPLRDRGPFNELAVTGRQWSSASALSGDYLAIDGRLDRIRLRVELALAPEPPVGVNAGPPPAVTRPLRSPRRPGRAVFRQRRRPPLKATI